MDTSKQRVMVRKSVAARKQQGRALPPASKAGAKRAPKRKNDGKDDHLHKKSTGSSARDKQ